MECGLGTEQDPEPTERGTEWSRSGRQHSFVGKDNVDESRRGKGVSVSSRHGPGADQETGKERGRTSG